MKNTSHRSAFEKTSKPLYFAAPTLELVPYEKIKYHSALLSFSLTSDTTLFEVSGVSVLEKNSLQLQIVNHVM